MKKNYFLKSLSFLTVFVCFLQTMMTAQNCTWTVNVSGSHGDQVSWQLRDANANVLLSGGNYSSYDYSETKTVESAGPVEFYVKTDRDIFKNYVIYKISNSNGLVATGTLDGIKEKTLSGLSCTDVPITGSQGCLDVFFEDFPAGAIYTPQCLATVETITNGGYAGQYSLVQVTEGTEYTFSSSINTDQITVGDEKGSNVLAYGQGSVTWTSPSNQVVRFYTHADQYCNFVNTFRQRKIKCGKIENPPANPDFPCFQGDGLKSNEFENAFSITAESPYRNVDDFLVEPGTSFKLKYVRLNVATFSQLSKIYFVIYKDDNGKPTNEEVATTEPVEPTSQILRGYNNIGFPMYEVSVNLPKSLDLAEGRYWLLPQAETVESDGEVYWEITSTGNNGFYTYSSVDYSPWESDERNYNAVFFVAGECNPLSTSDIGKDDISYYPNPVGERLFLQTKAKIKNVTVYNFSGQTVIDSLKVENGSVLTSKLKTGNYLFKIETEDGKSKTIKITKK